MHLVHKTRQKQVFSTINAVRLMNKSSFEMLCLVNQSKSLKNLCQINLGSY